MSNFANRNQVKYQIPDPSQFFSVRSTRNYHDNFLTCHSLFCVDQLSRVVLSSLCEFRSGYNICCHHQPPTHRMSLYLFCLMGHACTQRGIEGTGIIFISMSFFWLFAENFIFTDVCLGWGWYQRMIECNYWSGLYSSVPSFQSNNQSSRRLLLGCAKKTHINFLLKSSSKLLSDRWEWCHIRDFEPR